MRQKKKLDRPIFCLHHRLAEVVLEHYADAKKQMLLQRAEAREAAGLPFTA